MAFTKSFLAHSVFGNQLVKHIRVTADGAADAIETGLKVIEFVQWSPQSMASGAGKCKMNELAAATASNGYLAITGVANGDVIFVTVYGK